MRLARFINWSRVQPAPLALIAQRGKNSSCEYFYISLACLQLTSSSCDLRVVMQRYFKCECKVLWCTIMFYSNVFICILYFLHLALITELFITESKIILSRRRAHLGRPEYCAPKYSCKLYIMTAKKKNWYSIDILRTVEQIYIKLHNISTEQLKITCPCTFQLFFRRFLTDTRGNFVPKIFTTYTWRKFP